jgi:tRNA_anti-like
MTTVNSTTKTTEAKKRGCLFYAMVGFGALVGLGVIANIVNPKDRRSDAGAPTTGAPSRTAAPSPEAPPAIDVKVSAGDLFKAYEANEIAADQRFKDKLLEVTGKIDSIGKDILDTPYIALSTGGQFEILHVQAYFDEGALSQLANLSKGQSVTLHCRCDGKMMNVMLKDCTLK